MKKCEGKKAIKQVAKNKGVSIAEVRREIEIAIDIAMVNPDSNAQASWNQYTQAGTKPTPEEFIVYMAKQVKLEN